ncbi:5-bisphosphate-binding protein,Phosphatidylinositol 4 [Trichinella spiralis]|uniref:5-bisphosphate-binding protein,Phosphatidylinositol 4 n=1 Tax=Trichinella spiralis TaxID=6334 RepID=A0ABR3KUN8_TRISP
MRSDDQWSTRMKTLRMRGGFLEKKQQALKRNSRGFWWLCNRCSNLGNGATIYIYIFFLSPTTQFQPSEQTANCKYTHKPGVWPELNP